VREAERWFRTPFSGEAGESIDNGGQFAAEIVERFAHQNQVGIVGDVTTGRSEMDDVPAQGRDLAERVNVSHHVVPQPLFVMRGTVEINVVEVRPQFGDLFCLDSRRLAIVGEEAEFALGFGHRQPEFPPEPMLAPRSPTLGHRLRGIASNQRVVVKQIRIVHEFAV
jgi:hypothetical protein